MVACLTRTPIRSLVVLAASLCVLLLACSDHNARLRSAAEALSKCADECLYDVRDRHLTWETSSNCAALGVLAKEYTEAGGFQHEPAEIRLIAERARVSAWMARAISLANGRPLSVW